MHYGTRVWADSYLETGVRAASPVAHLQHRGSHRGAAWWPLTCSLCRSAGPPHQGPGCWCLWGHDPKWSDLERGEQTGQCGTVSVWWNKGNTEYNWFFTVLIMVLISSMQVSLLPRCMEKGKKSKKKVKVKWCHPCHLLDTPHASMLVWDND